MREVVKEFIEATIDKIDDGDYYEVFTIWYLHYATNKSVDRDNLDNLFHVFDSAGIDLYHRSADARKNIVEEHLYNLIDDILSNNHYADVIDLPTALKHLNSKLNVSLIDLNNIFKDVGRRLMSTHDISLEPFKIVRNK